MHYWHTLAMIRSELSSQQIEHTKVQKPHKGTLQTLARKEPCSAL